MISDSVSLKQRERQKELKGHILHIISSASKGIKTATHKSWTNTCYDGLSAIKLFFHCSNFQYFPFVLVKVHGTAEHLAAAAFASLHMVCHILCIKSMVLLQFCESDSKQAYCVCTCLGIKTKSKFFVYSAQLS